MLYGLINAFYGKTDVKEWLVAVSLREKERTGLVLVLVTLNQAANRAHVYGMKLLLLCAVLFDFVSLRLQLLVNCCCAIDECLVLLSSSKFSFLKVFLITTSW